MFTFNRNYKDLGQMEEYLPAFEARLAELEAAGEYRYNDSFKGYVPGIEGPDEDTAIFLLQNLERQRRMDEKAARLIADGFEYVDSVDGTEKFKCVVLYPDVTKMQGEWARFEGARLVAEDWDQQAEVTGRVRAVLPKGKRTHGYLVNGRRVLALR